ncbi:hypothetical protein KKC32_01440 [Patescibacteria group bacterium]|nr:hypothetical protein [Patescibacteria group bacterium]
MKRLSHYLEKVFLLFVKIIVAILLGIASSFGKKLMEMEKKNNKIIETKK